MMASSMSEVLAVDAASVIRVASSFHFVARLATRYARLFLEKMLQCVADGDMITDMSAFSTDVIEAIVDRAYFKPKHGSQDGPTPSNHTLREEECEITHV